MLESRKGFIVHQIMSLREIEETRLTRAKEIIYWTGVILLGMLILSALFGNEFFMQIFSGALAFVFGLGFFMMAICEARDDQDYRSLISLVYSFGYILFGIGFALMGLERVLETLQITTRIGLADYVFFTIAIPIHFAASVAGARQ